MTPEQMHEVLKLAEELGWEIPSGPVHKLREQDATSHQALMKLHEQVLTRNEELQASIEQKDAVISQFEKRENIWVNAEKELSAAKQREAMLVEALKFYADGCHFIQHQDVWESVSGEPENFLEDENNTATVEDGSIAKQVIANSKPHADKWLAEVKANAGETALKKAAQNEMFISTVEQELLRMAQEIRENGK